LSNENGLRLFLIPAIEARKTIMSLFSSRGNETLRLNQRVRRDNLKRVQLSNVGAAVGSPRNRRHHGVNTGKMKKKIATAVITAAIGRVKKIASDP
jgi:hypothetical protein